MISGWINSVTFNINSVLEEPMKRSATLFLMGLMIAYSACAKSRQASPGSAAPSDVQSLVTAERIIPQGSPAIGTC